MTPPPPIGLRHHDATHFEVFVYALTPGDGSAARDVTEGSVEHFKDISLLSDSDAARVINADGIHVLINLTPYLRGDRGGILALRPAPVQTHYFGFPASVGEGLADYIITDAFVSPRSHESQYAEKLVQLPGCCFLADYRTLSAEVLEEEGLPSREDLGLPRHAFVVACFNPPATFSPEFWDLCCDTLRSAKGAVLCVAAAQEPGVTRIPPDARTAVSAPSAGLCAGPPPQNGTCGPTRRREVCRQTASSSPSWFLAANTCVDATQRTSPSTRSSSLARPPRSTCCGRECPSCAAPATACPSARLPPSPAQWGWATSSRMWQPSHRSAPLRTALTLPAQLLCAGHGLTRARPVRQPGAAVAAPRPAQAEPAHVRCGSHPQTGAYITLARGCRCPVFDTKKGIEVLERALKMIWRRHEDGKAPAHVAVPAPKRSR